jgi:prevent-host-death family protein
MSTSERLALGQARVVTMRELSQQTAQVMADVNDEGRPAVVTRHGRFVGIILPLRGEKVESFLLANLDEFLGIQDFDDQETEAVAESGVRAAFEADVSAEELTRRLEGSRPEG